MSGVLPLLNLTSMNVGTTLGRCVGAILACESPEPCALERSAQIATSPYSAHAGPALNHHFKSTNQYVRRPVLIVA